MTTVYKWSTTAATNSTADATINWAEGQAPSSVNDSARAMMAAVAKWRDDMSGRLVTTGGTTAYALTSNQGFSSLAAMDGATLAFKINTTCTANPTLNVDALGAKNLTSPQGTQLGASALTTNRVSNATYNNAASEWIVQTAIQIGELLTGSGTVTPSSGVATNVASVAFGTGDWLVSGYCTMSGAVGTTATVAQASLSTSSGVAGADLILLTLPSGGALSVNGTITIPTKRFSGSATAFLVAQTTWSGGTGVQAAGSIYALRIG